MLQAKNVSRANFSLAELLNNFTFQFLRSCSPGRFIWSCRELVSLGTLRLALSALLRCSHGQRRSFCFVLVEKPRDVLDEKIVYIVIIIVYLADVRDWFWHIGFARSFIRVKFNQVLNVFRLLMAIHPFLSRLGFCLLFRQVVDQGLWVKVRLFLLVLGLLCGGRIYLLLPLLNYALIVKFCRINLHIHRRNLRYFVFDFRLIFQGLHNTALNLYFFKTVDGFGVFWISCFFARGSLLLYRIRLRQFQCREMRLFCGCFNLLSIGNLR